MIEDIYVKMITNTMPMYDTPEPLEDAALTLRLSPDFNSEYSGDDVDLSAVEKMGSDNAALELGGDEAASESNSNKGASESEAASESGSDEGGPEPSSDEGSSQPDSDSFGAEFQQLLHGLNGGPDRSGLSVSV